MGAVIGVIVSTTLLVLNAYTKSYDIGEFAQKHRRAAADLWLIREKYLALITDLRVGKESIENICERLDAILEELHGGILRCAQHDVRGIQEGSGGIEASGHDFLECRDRRFLAEGTQKGLPKACSRTALRAAADTTRYAASTARKRELLAWDWLYTALAAGTKLRIEGRAGQSSRQAAC